MFVIPNLCETPFDRIEAELSITIDELGIEDYEAGLPWGDAQFCRIEGDPLVLASVELGDDQENGELHAVLSLSRETSGRFTLKSRLPPRWNDKWEEGDIDSLASLLAAFPRRRASLDLVGTFSLERARIPTQSIIASMIGLRTQAGEEQYLLSGAQFAVRGFPDDTISWYLVPGSGGQEVSGQVVRRCIELFDMESIANAVHVLETRFNRVVLAQGNIRADVTS